jgi:HK97 family phage major capsid protein
MSATDVLRRELADTLKDPGLAQELHEAWRGMDLKLGTPDLGFVDSYFDEKLMPKIEARMAEERSRARAELQFVPPDAAALTRMETPLNERAILRPAGTNEALREQQRFGDDIYLLWQLGNVANDPGATTRRRQAYLKAYFEENEVPEHIRTALVTGTSHGASEWVPTLLSSEFYELIQGNLVVTPLFPESRMPGKNLNLPTVAGRADAYKQTEGSAVSEDASITSNVVSFTAVDIAAFRDFTSDLEEDSIVPTLQIVKAAVSEGIAYGIDRTVLDGDESATHMDTTHAAITHSWDGLRHQALINATGANADISTWCMDTLNAIAAAMGKYNSPRDLVLIMGPLLWWKRLPTTVDNGTNKNPVFLPGTFAGLSNQGAFTVYLMGVPVIMSNDVREDVDATGVNAAGGNTYTYCIWVNTRTWRMGTRREVTVKYADSDAASIKAGTATVVATWRGDFNMMEASSALTVGMGYKAS